MIDTLVVVATHGSMLIERHLRKMTTMYTHPVLVVETGPSTPAVRKLVDATDNALYLNTPYSGYDTGAYLWAFWNVAAKNYLFMQDSCFPREGDYVEQFARAMPGSMGVVGWSSFDINIWDSPEQREATAWMYGDPMKWPPKGIFGPIFYTNDASLKYMASLNLLPMPPVHKQQQQAMERAWAILFHRAGIRANFLVNEDSPRGFDMMRGAYPALQKTFEMRS